MNIVVIDSGVDFKHKVFDNVNVLNYTFNKKIDDWELNMQPKITNGHGTAVSSIIVNGINNLTLYSFVLFDSLESSNEELVKCLQYISKNIECSLINMSLGTVTYCAKLYDICKELSEKNIIIVSAFDNNGGISYPAAFDCVIGVDASFRCKKKDDFVYIENSVVNVKAKGLNQRVAWLDNKYQITQGASYSCGYVSNYILKLLLKEQINLEQVLNHFSQNNIYKYDNALIGDVSHQVEFKRIALYPYNKEISSIINCSSLYGLEISGVYESVRLGHVGLQVKSFYGDNELTIKSIDECNWNDFDIMVIGHVDEQEQQLNINIKQELLEQCLIHKKNVYCFDNYFVDKYYWDFQKNGLFIYYPSVLEKFDYKINMGKLYTISKPVVGVFGTSKQQGKFTLQLLLRAYMSELGYKIGQLGSEPQSLLFGFDYVFPFGYESNITMGYDVMIPILNYYMHLIDMKDVDLIIVGSQAGTAPQSFENIMYFNDHQIDFLCGTLPDAVILSINYHDSIEYIQRTIDLIESLVDCKVIALCIFPLGYENEWDLMMDNKKAIDIDSLSAFKNNVSKKVRRPVFILGEENTIENIILEIQAFFSETEWE